MLLIGLIGPAGSGKNTAVAGLHRGLCNVIGKYGAVEVAFATKLRQVVSEIYGISPLAMVSYEDKAKQHPALPPGWTVRDALQRVGCALRDEDPDVWVCALFADLDKDPVGSPVFVTDVRFPNEVAHIKSRGGIIVQIVRPGLVIGNHISEHALDGLQCHDYTILNDGSLEAFHDACMLVGERIALQYGYNVGPELFP